MSEFIAEGLVDGQRVILVKTVDGTIEQTNAFLSEVVVDDGSGHLQRCIAIKDLGGGGGASALSDLSDVDLSGLEDGQCLIYDSESGKWINGTIEALPDQTGNAGKSLYTDGTDASWEVTRDPNTYRSLSSAQETTLLSTGLYNGEKVTSGEIFTTEDGAFKEYSKEEAHTANTVDLGFNTGSNTLSTQKFNNGAFVLTYNRGDEKNYFLSDRGATWTEIAPDATSSFTSSKKITYTATVNGIEYGYFMKFAYGNTTVRKTVDGVNFDAQVQVSLPFWADPQEGLMTAFNSMGKVCIYWFNKKNSTPQQRFMYATDPESTWSEVTMPDANTYYFLPFDDEVRIVRKSDNKIFSSTDLSQGFTDTGKTMPLTVFDSIQDKRWCLFVVNGVVYINTNSGIFYSLDRGETFTQTSLSGLRWAIVYVSEQQTYVAISSQKNGKYYVSENGKDDWVEKEATAGTSIYNDLANNQNGCLFTDGAKAYTVGSYGTGSTRINVGINWNRSLTSLSYNKDEVDALIGGAGSLEDIAQTGNGIKFTDSIDNFTVHGSPVVSSDGMVSGFSGYDYLTASLSQTVSAGNVNSFEVEVDIVTPETITHNASRIFNTYTQGSGSDTDNGPFVGYGSSGVSLVFYDGSNYYSFEAVTNPALSTRYQCKWVFDGTDVKSYYKLPNDSDWTLNSTDACSSTTPRFAESLIYVGKRDRDSGDVTVFDGSCYMPNFKITVNGSLLWEGVSKIKTEISVDIGSGASAPTSSTEGYVGKLYVTSGGAVYICTGVSGSTYTWSQITVS